MSNTHDYDSKSALRAAFGLRELGKAQRSLSGGLPGLVVRAALVTVFMYLVVIGYELMGTTGALFVSGLFLVSVFIPVLVRMAMRFWAKRRASLRLETRQFETDARDEA